MGTAVTRTQMSEQVELFHNEGTVLMKYFSEAVLQALCMSERKQLVEEDGLRSHH